METIERAKQCVTKLRQDTAATAASLENSIFRDKTACGQAKEYAVKGSLSSRSPIKEVFDSDLVEWVDLAGQPGRIDILVRSLSDAVGLTEAGVPVKNLSPEASSPPP